MNNNTGELAALLTSVMFAATSTIFTLAGRQVGPAVLNRARLLLAILFLFLTHLFLGIQLPLNASADRWFWLGISGIIGLSIGDAFLFTAFIAIGPRLSMLLMSLAPVVGAVLAWIFFGETLRAGQTAGMLLALAGVGWVVMDPRGSKNAGLTSQRNYQLGVLAGLGAMTGQSVGLVTAKMGVAGSFPALSGTLIRMLAAAVVLWGYTLIRREAGSTFKQLSTHRRATPLILAGSLFGPFLGVTLSLVAIQNTEVGVASTLMALPPVILLPVGYYFFHERFGWRAVIGTLLAIAGVALLFLS